MKEETREALEFIRGYVKNDPCIVHLDKDAVKVGIPVGLAFYVICAFLLLLGDA